MVEDISKSTIVILVVLTLAVSMVGTWAVLDEMSSIPVAEPAPSAANVKLTIEGQTQSEPDFAGAQVSLKITPPEEY